MLNFCELNETEFQEFVDKCQNKHFMQTKYMNNYYKLKGRETFFIGVKQDNNIIAAALVYLESQFKKYKRYDIYKGFVMDYNNTELLNFITNETAKYLKNKDAYMFTIDPNLIVIQRDTDANIVENGLNNQNIVDYLKSIGYIKSEKDMQVRWTYVLDIDGMNSEEIFKTFKPNTRNNINKTINKFKLNIRTLSYNQLEEFKKVTSDTSERRGFNDKSLKYFQDLFKSFENNITVKIAEINFKDYLQELNNEESNLNFQLNELEVGEISSKSAKAKYNNLLNEKNALEKRIVEAKNLIEKHGETVTLSAAMFITYGDEVIYYSSGSYKEFMQFYGQYAIQWEMIKYACEHNYKRYNFYGLIDIFDKKGKDYGVYEFKKGFNGHVEELFGEYTYILNKKIYNAHKLISKLKSILKREK